MQGTSDYDISRTAAWCDRILYKRNDYRIRKTWYDSVPSLLYVCMYVCVYVCMYA